LGDEINTKNIFKNLPLPVLRPVNNPKIFKKFSMAHHSISRRFSGYHLMGALEKMNNLSGIKLSKKQQMIDRTL
jgi:hypothetical protein